MSRLRLLPGMLTSDTLHRRYFWTSLLAFLRFAVSSLARYSEIVSEDLPRLISIEESKV